MPAVYAAARRPWHHGAMTRRGSAFPVLTSLTLLALAAPAPAQAPPQVAWWQKTFDEALVAAKDSKAGLVLLYCWRDKDGFCQSMFGGTLSDKTLVEPLGEFVCMGVKDDAAGKPVLERFGIAKVPTVLFVAPDGAVVDVVAGYVPVAEFTAELARVRAGTKTIPALREAMAASAADLTPGLELLRKLRAAGDTKGALAAGDAILAKDPKAASEAGAEAMLLRLTEQIFAPGVAPADYDLKPLKDFLGKQKNKRILFLGYDRLAAAEWRRDNLKVACDAAEKAWKNIPPDQVLDWGQNVAGKAYEAWKELEKIDKAILKQALDVSQKALTEVEKQHKAKPDNAWMASALYLHAAMQVVNNQRKEAFAGMDKAIALDPENENLKKAKEFWVGGGK
jgi:tetratricopeptide (TPR) repeat protein